MTDLKTEVITPDGVKIDVRNWPHKEGAQPMLFLHGFSQSQDCWDKQTTAPQLSDYHIVTYDNRGHGRSEKPEDMNAYRDGQYWADEVNAVIHQLQLVRPILVVWSYAGRIALDYLSKYGSTDISGLVMVAATSNSNAMHHGPSISLLAEMANEDEALAAAAVRPFLENCTYCPLPVEELDKMHGCNELTPTFVRRALMGRPADYDDVLRSLKVPVLAIHGAEDRVILPSMAEHTVALAPKSECRIYPEIGHMPFWECAETFNSDLARFASKV